MTKPLRLQMPKTAEFIDEMRAAFGKDVIDSIIRAGMDGQPVFHATENGHEIGTVVPYCAERSVSMSDIDVKPFDTTAAHSASRTKGK